MWHEMLWPLAAAQQSMDLVNRQMLASQCRLLRDYLNELNTNCRLPHDIELMTLDINGRAAELLSPKGSPTQRYMLYLHGGGFALGSLDTHRELAMAFARHADARVLAIDYRLAPDYPWPAGLEDALAACHWLLEQGVTPERLAIGGDSAGGGLAVSLLQSLRREGHRQPAACVLLSPWVDLSCSSPSMDLNAATDPLLNRVQMRAFAELYAGKQPLDSPAISPLFGDLQGLAPLHVQVSLQEVLRDDARRLVQGVQQQGGRAEIKETAWMPHVWQLLYRYLPQAASSVRQASRFIKAFTAAA
ncbi:alpha/beta hydrolase [Marinospirillum alkaliphilum]|uniref:Acetyl esterase/lipase n=1 Tax=Marinospirillum alkaliphilum DSM 21637 TaxID=1122209 RepID=A0A1K1U100_9GAMM|nr:alpha/beta hydrolase [Marinospirillum alkaliphilum]SFX06641.1 Acetyl esterase/lipase [Marinospirillum alkaliphilum DSM 21637]